MATTDRVPDGRPAAAGRLRRRLRRRGYRERLLALACLLSGLAAGQLIAPVLSGPRPAPPSPAPSSTNGDQAADGRSPDSSPPLPRNTDRPDPDQRAVALTRPMALPPVVAGDQVELLSVTVDEVGSVAVQFLGTRPVTVLTVDSDTITVAVPAGEVIALLEHQARGTIEVVAIP